MVEGVTPPILLHLSSIREMMGDTTTIVYTATTTDLTDIRYSKQTEESGSILTPPGRCDGSHTKTSHLSIEGHCLLAHDQFRSALPPEGIGEHDRELL